MWIYGHVKLTSDSQNCENPGVQNLFELNILESLHFNDFAEANEKNLSDRQKVSLRSLNRIDIRIVTIYFSHMTSVSILINPAD